MSGGGSHHRRECAQRNISGIFSLSRNGFNHKCNWWINIVTWRGMAKVECTNHPAKVPHFICMHIFLRRRPHPRSFQSMTRSDFYRSRRRKSEEFFLFSPSSWIFFNGKYMSFMFARAQIFDRFCADSCKLFCYRLAWNVPLPGVHRKPNEKWRRERETKAHARSEQKTF